MCRGRCEACQAAGRQDDGECGGKTGKTSGAIKHPSVIEIRGAGILLVLPTEEAAIRKARRLGFKLTHDPVEFVSLAGSAQAP